MNLILLSEGDIRVKQKSFFRGALILSLAGIISKLLGAVYRIPFARLVGDEGVGLYQMAYPFYTMILAVSTAGVPLAISKLVAERYSRKDHVGIQRIFRVSFTLLLTIGILGFLLLFFSAEFIANNILKEPRAALSLKAIAPAIILTSAMATFRGYFQGLQNMTPTAVSQIFEQIIRVSTVFWAAFYLLPLGVEFAAAGATFGAATGAAAALFLLSLIYFWHINKKLKNNLLKRPEKQESLNVVIKQILYLAIPISIGGLVLPLMQTLDAFLVPARLQAAGFSTIEATSLYGQLSGMAGAIINLPFIITTALAASLVPAVSESLAQGCPEWVKGQFSGAMRLTLIIVLPATVGLLVLAQPICKLLYDLPEAGISLAWLAPSVLAIGVYQTSAGLLQGLGKPIQPVISLLWATVLKVVLTFTLTSLPQMGLKGAALSTVLAFAVAAIRNLFVANSLIPKNWFKLGDHLLKPITAVLVMGICVLAIYEKLLFVGVKEQISTLLAILSGGIIYFLVLLIVGGIKGQDIEKVPKWGNVLAKILRKIKLVRD